MSNDYESDILDDIEDDAALDLCIGVGDAEVRIIIKKLFGKGKDNKREKQMVAGPGQSGSVPPVTTDYLLTEDGDNFVLEDGSGNITLEA